VVSGFSGGYMAQIRFWCDYLGSSGDICRLQDITTYSAVNWIGYVCHIYACINHYYYCNYLIINIIILKIMAQKTDFLIVNYSQKALAVFGDTKPIKDQLKELGGRFNPKLLHEGTKKAGWIFSKTKEQELRNLLRDLLTIK